MSEGTVHSPPAPLAALHGPLGDLGARGLLPAECEDGEAALRRAAAFLQAVGDDHADGAALVAFAPVEALALAVRGDLDRLVIVDDEPTLGFLSRAIDHLGLAASVIPSRGLAGLESAPLRLDLVVRASDRAPLRAGSGAREVVVSPAPRGLVRPWRLTPWDLADVLGDRAPGLWEPLGGGGDFLVYRRGGDLLRVARHPGLRRAMVREAALLHWIAPLLPVAVPALTLVVEEAALCFVGPLLPGRAPGHEDFVDALAAELAVALAGLHGVHVASSPPAAAPANRLDTSPRRCWRRLRAAIDREALTRGYGLPEDRGATLRRLLPGVSGAALAGMASLVFEEPPAPTAALGLIHGDLGYNLLVDDAGRLAGILDWTDAGLGDPARDLGYLAALGGAGFLAALLRHYPRSQGPADHRRIAFYRRSEALVGALDLVADGGELGPWIPRICEAFVDG